MSKEIVFSLWEKLRPTEWTKVLSLDPLERAKTFFVPGVDDVACIEIARRELFGYINGSANHAESRCRTMHYAGNDSREFSDSVSLALDWWHGMMFGAVRYCQEQQTHSLRVVWPNVEFSLFKVDNGSSCCETCAALDGVVVEKFSHLYYEFLPPWHIGCNLSFILRNRAIKPTQCISVPEGTLRLYNPVDFVEAFGLAPPHRRQIKKGTSVFSRIKRMLVQS